MTGDVHGEVAAEVERVLAGDLPYDLASEDAQTIVRDPWDLLFKDNIAALDMSDVLSAGTDS